MASYAAGVVRPAAELKRLEVLEGRQSLEHLEHVEHPGPYAASRTMILPSSRS
jgi:hypothetical protein